MNNTDIDQQTINSAESGPRVRMDGGIAQRVALVFVLTITLFAALRWAMNVTNANAKQITTNLNRVRQKMEEDAHTSHTPPSSVR